MDSLNRSVIVSFIKDLHFVIKLTKESNMKTCTYIVMQHLTISLAGQAPLPNRSAGKGLVKLAWEFCSAQSANLTTVLITARAVEKNISRWIRLRASPASIPNLPSWTQF